jgi:excisionase family DNA binding protein
MSEPETALAMSVEEACWAVSMGRSKMFEYIRSGELPSVKIGRRRLVLRKDLIAWIESQPAA